MRILVISNYYPPYEVGGYEQLCRDVAMRLGAHGHQVQVLTSSHQLSAGLPALEHNVNRSLHLEPDYSFKLGLAAEFFLTRRREEQYNLKELRRQIAACQPDVIFIWNLQRLPRSLATTAESIPGVAVAYWLAGYTPAEPDEFWIYWNAPGKQSLLKATLAPLARAMMRREGKPVRPRMRHAAVVSDYMRQRYIAASMLPEDSQVIYNGVELDMFYQPVQPANGTLRLLQAGRVSPDKGVHISIEAIARLVHEHGVTDLHLTIAGSGPAEYQTRLQNLIAERHLEDKVSLSGWLPREQLPQVMAQAHILLLPSDYPEAFARVVLEAMASGEVVVATLRGGTGEIVRNNETGLTFSANDSSDLARQILRLTADDSLRCRLAAQGQRLVLEQFGLERMVDRLEHFLAEACTRPNEVA